ATRSGLTRLSDVGPRDEKHAMPSERSDTWPAAPIVVKCVNWLQLASSPGVGVEPWGRLFSVAPTVRQFFAVAGLPTEPGSITPSLLLSRPSLPAANRTRASRCVAMNWSTLRAFAV